MVRNGHNVSICIWYEMVIMYFFIWFEMVMCQSAYGTKWSYNVSICIWYEMVISCIDLHMVRNGHNVSICVWYEVVIMYRSAYGTKWQWYEMVMVRNDYNSKKPSDDQS
jgi:hypothetical protein